VVNTARVPCSLNRLASNSFFSISTRRIMCDHALVLAAQALQFLQLLDQVADARAQQRLLAGQ
jgi:hypothetical protein